MNQMKKILTVLGIVLLLAIMPFRVAAASLNTPVLKKAASVSYNSIKLYWGKVPKATGYIVYRKQNGGQFKKIASVTGTSYVNQKVKCGVTYVYTVKAYKKTAGKTLYSAYNKKGIKGKAVPVKVRTIKTAVADNSVKISWSKVPGASGYLIVRANADDGKYCVIATKNASTLKYTDKNLKNGKYKYRVRAYRVESKKKTYGAYSNVSTCSVAAAVTRTDSFSEFGRAVSEMINEADIPDNISAAAADEFYCCRLIVKGKSDGLTFDEYSPQTIIAGPEHYYVLGFKNSTDTKKAYVLLCNDSRIEYVEPDSYVTIDSEDADFEAQDISWGARLTGALKLASHVKKKTSSTIKVAVVDTGVGKHSFINDRLLSGYDFVDNDNRPVDVNGHGTRVTGIIVDCTPGLDVKVIPVRVLDEIGNGHKTVIANGIRYAIEKGAEVINLSLSGEKTNYIDDAVNAAIKQGITVVAAAGNQYNYTNNYSPAHMKDAIVVGAVDINKNRAAFSNRGKTIDLVGPGVGICSTLPGNRMGMSDGTSMAAPHITAAAAMILLLNPAYSPADVEEELKSICVDLGKAGFDTSYGYGFPDLERLIRKEPVDIKPTGIKLNVSSVSVDLGKTYTLTASVSPDNATDKTVTWSSSNTAVATVKNGTITGKTAGTATITAKTGNGITASCRVTVVNPVIAVTGISLSADSATVKTGESYTLTAVVSPENASNKNVTWSSSAPDIASVNNGVVTGIEKGTAVITARTDNGKTAACTITVTSSGALSLSSTSLTMDVGDYCGLVLWTTSDDVSIGNIAWTSSDPSIASVNNQGVITGKKAGRAVISVAADEYFDHITYSAECHVVVREIDKPSHNNSDQTGILKKYSEFLGDKDSMFSLIYLTNDNIPDLAYLLKEENYVIPRVNLNGEVVINISSNNSASYYPKTGVTNQTTFEGYRKNRYIGIHKDPETSDTIYQVEHNISLMQYYSGFANLPSFREISQSEFDMVFRSWVGNTKEQSIVFHPDTEENRNYYLYGLN